MGIYECVHDCGDGDFCVSIGSSLDGFKDTQWICCNKHKKIAPGSKFKYNLTRFINQFSNENTYDNIYDVEVVDLKNMQIRDGTIQIVRFKLGTSFQDVMSNLIESRKINFSIFDNDVTSWEQINDTEYIITLQFFTNDIHRPIYNGNEYYFNWDTHQVSRR